MTQRNDTVALRHMRDHAAEAAVRLDLVWVRVRPRGLKSAARWGVVCTGWKPVPQFVTGAARK